MSVHSESSAAMPPSIATPANVDFARNLLIQQYFQILNALDIQREEENPAKVYDSQFGEIETLACSEDLDCSYDHQCGQCGEITMYCRRPPHDYPLPLCLSNTCITSILTSAFESLTEESQKKLMESPDQIIF